MSSEVTGEEVEEVVENERRQKERETRSAIQNADTPEREPPVEHDQPSNVDLGYPHRGSYPSRETTSSSFLKCPNLGSVDWMMSTRSFVRILALPGSGFLPVAFLFLGACFLVSLTS